MKCPLCGSECVQNEDFNDQWYCEQCGLVIDENGLDDSDLVEPPEPPEPDTAARSFRETYVEAWHEHQKAHRR